MGACRLLAPTSGGVTLCSSASTDFYYDNNNHSATMSSNPDDISNNPYNEGGTRSTPAPSQSVWFCHSCQRDIPGNQLLRAPDPQCPFCHGDFVEETGCVEFLLD
ncbi:hypothetical protein P389DRAFT_50176 [Cystobasidium minutum MCA 4210]|uniref:uncharacterized protein n=1 Tax=Cystobasidium minutum MCA 4210 TaxID=1397322 RepID=UPI0034CD362A|eukprot:jgi/Rhomi1/50176/CE50175_175